MLHLGLLNFLGEAEAVFDISYIKWYLVLIFFAIIGVYIVFEVLILKYAFRFGYADNRYYILGVLTALVIISVSVVLTTLSYKKIYKDNKIIADSAAIDDGNTTINFYTKYLRNSSFDNYGVLTFYKSDFSIKYLSAPCGKEITQVIEEKNPNNNMHGILAGYNIFTIMVETGIDGLITKEYTPTLYMLMHDGLNFTNNYSKNKTSVSEIIGFTGSYPNDGIDYNYTVGSKRCVYDLKINTPYALTNLLGVSYHKSFFHDGEGLYARNSLIGQFGFDSWRHEFFDVHPYGTKGWDFDGSYELDSDYIDIVLDDMYRTDKPFYTFYTTLSTHGPYEEYQGKTTLKARDDYFEEIGYASLFEEHYDEVYGNKYPQISDNKYRSYLKHLTCAFMDLDKAIKKIVDRLKEENLFDRTLFVIYGDHDAYYHQSATNPGLSRILTNTSSVSEPEQYHTQLFFYNKTLTDAYRANYEVPASSPCEAYEFVSPYIIVPTVLDLLGYDYETKYYYSLSYFDFKTKYDGLFYSSELGAFFNDVSFSKSPGNYSYLDKSLTKNDEELLEQIENTKLLKLKIINDYYKEWFYFDE